MADAARLLDFDAPQGAAPVLDFVAGPPREPVPSMNGEMSLDSMNLDGWYSAITGIGTSTNDKRLDYKFSAAQLTYAQAIEMWRGDDMARAAIEKVPEQCFRQGYEIEIPDEGKFESLKADLEEMLGDLGTDEVIERAMKQERALGGSAILIGVDDGRPLSAPLDPDRVRRVDWLKVLEPIELYPWKMYEDPYKSKYGEPELFQLSDLGGMASVQTAGLAAQTRGRRAPGVGQHLIHESRLILFPGIRVSNYQVSTNFVSPMWGDSILVRMVEVLRDFNITWHAAGILATDFSQSVISIENLMGLVARNKEGLRLRMEALELGRSVARALLLDTKEKYERQSTNLAGFPELLEKISRRWAGAAETPLSILLGAGEMGIGKDGLSDVRHWYDGISGQQRRKVAPVIKRIGKLCMGTLRKRKIPPHWGVKFAPLWQLTDKEKADARLTQARADLLYIKGLVVSPDEMRFSRFGGGFSFETQIDEKQHAQDMKTVVGMAEKAAEAALLPTGPGATTTVRPHTRGGPSDVGEQVSVKEGGDVSGTGSATRDDADMPVMIRPFAGLPIGVENEKGSVRQWRDRGGNTGETKMRYAYGFIEGTAGADGDSVDVYLGPNQNAEYVYVVHQMAPPTFVDYDEDKAMIGFDSENHARDAYLGQYDDERFLGAISTLTMAQFVGRLRASTDVIRSDEGEHADARKWPKRRHADFIEERDGKWVVLSTGGKVLGTHESRDEAVAQLGVIEAAKRVRPRRARRN